MATRNRSAKPSKGSRAVSKNKRNVRSKTLTGVVLQRFGHLSQPAKAFIAALLVGAMGVLLLLLTSAQSSLPTQENQAVFFYRTGHGHQLYEADFEDIDYPTVLYADGLLVCGTHDYGGSKELVPTVKQALLSEEQIREFVRSVREQGFDKLKAGNYQVDQETIEPSALKTTLYVNAGARQKVSSYTSGEKPAAFSQVEHFVTSYCQNNATEEYVAENYRVDSVPSSERAAQAVPERQGLQRATAAVSGRLEQNHRLANAIRSLEDASLVQSVQLDRHAAAELKRVLQGASAGRLEISGQSFDVRITPLLREYVLEGAQEAAAAQPETDRVYAGAAKTVEFVWFYASDRSLASGASSKLWSISNNVRSWYKSKINEDVIHGGNRVYKGAKTLAQYETCPSGVNCHGDKLLAAYYNTQAEMKTTDAQVVVLFQGSTTTCGGWGGGGNVSLADGTVGSSTKGYAIINMTGCTWANGWETISAHELGHGFGSGHWCHNLNIMVSSSCATRAGSLSTALLNATQAGEWRSRSWFFRTSPSYLNRGEVKYGYSVLISPNRRYQLRLQQSDGNMFIRDTSTGKTIWSARTYGYPNTRASFQTNGDFVAYKSNGTTCSSRSGGKNGYRMSLQDDGNLVIRRSDGVAIWSSKGSPWYC